VRSLPEAKATCGSQPPCLGGRAAAAGYVPVLWQRSKALLPSPVWETDVSSTLAARSMPHRRPHTLPRFSSTYPMSPIRPSHRFPDKVSATLTGCRHRRTSCLLQEDTTEKRRVQYKLCIGCDGKLCCDEDGVDQDQRNAGKHGYSVQHVLLMVRSPGWQAVAVCQTSAGHTPSAGAEASEPRDTRISEHGDRHALPYGDTGGADSTPACESSGRRERMPFRVPSLCMAVCSLECTSQTSIKADRSLLIASRTFDTPSGSMPERRCCTHKDAIL
jgi:hypothetical protein